MSLCPLNHVMLCDKFVVQDPEEVFSLVELFCKVATQVGFNRNSNIADHELPPICNLCESSVNVIWIEYWINVFPSNFFNSWHQVQEITTKYYLVTKTPYLAPNRSIKHWCNSLHWWDINILEPGYFRVAKYQCAEHPYCSKTTLDFLHSECYIWVGVRFSSGNLGEYLHSNSFTPLKLIFSPQFNCVEKSHRIQLLLRWQVENIHE